MLSSPCRSTYSYVLPRSIELRSPAIRVVGTGQTMKQAQAQVYSRIKNILIPNMYYRTDIGDSWAEDSDKLHNWGYLR